MSVPPTTLKKRKFWRNDTIKRYRRQKAKAVLTVLKDFEDTVATSSHAVIAGNFGIVFKLLNSDNELYTTYYQLVEADAVMPGTDEMSRYRNISEDAVFPGYKKHIRFAAITLDDIGLSNYAWKKGSTFAGFEIHMTLDDDMIAHRTSVFEENNAVLVKQLDLRASELVDFPKGHRATWEDRGKLAAVKLENLIDKDTKTDEYQGILLRQGDDKNQDNFIEAHIYGSFTRRSLKSAIIKRPKRSGMKKELKILKEKLEKVGVQIDVID